MARKLLDSHGIKYIAINRLQAFIALEDENIAFNAGTHTELIQLSYQDFERLTHPKVVSLSSKD